MAIIENGITYYKAHFVEASTIRVGDSVKFPSHRSLPSEYKVTCILPKFEPFSEFRRYYLLDVYPSETPRQTIKIHRDCKVNLIQM
jgi:hypothetical protein